MKAATRALRKSQGSQLAISSVTGFSPVLLRAAYAVSKHALTGFFASSNAEERVYGVHVLLGSPSFVATNVGALNKQSDIQRSGAADAPLDHMCPSTAAKVIVNALNSPFKNGSLLRACWIWPDFRPDFVK